VVAPPATEPCMVALSVPPTVKPPVIVAEPDTTKEPVTTGSNIFISYIVLYNNKYFNIFI